MTGKEAVHFDPRYPITPMPPCRHQDTGHMAASFSPTHFATVHANHPGSGPNHPGQAAGLGALAAVATGDQAPDSLQLPSA